jgi:hypothetical protein
LVVVGEFVGRAVLFPALSDFVALRSGQVVPCVPPA